VIQFQYLYCGRDNVLDYIWYREAVNTSSGGLGVKRDTSNVEIRGSNPRRSFLPGL
jgi:hypothetical protein